MRYYVWLQSCIKQGSKSVSRLFGMGSNPKKVYETEDLEKLNIFSKPEIERIKSTPITVSDEILRYCQKHTIKIITFEDKEYPEVLRQISNPPLCLYVKGDFPDFDNTPAISIVGPRNVSEFGKKAAYSLGYRLAKSGMLVISGGAVGTDTLAHIGALKSDGKTVLVMGCGFGVSYLEENRALREHIMNHGCIISEFPPKTHANKLTFPIRNRIISALGVGTIVVEAGKKSGALITANHALEQGKDVFVIPGCPELSEYKGSNALLRDGAKPLLDTSDIFNEYILRFPEKIDIEKAFKKEPKPQRKEKIKKILNETLSNEAKIVYNCLDNEKFYPDELDTGLDGNKLLSALTELEMEFIIRALPGGQYEICK